MNLQLYGLAAAITFFAELPDKTAFTSFILSTQKRPMAVFAGGALAMVVHSAIAVGLGTLLSALPPEPIRLGAGAVFLAFAVLMLLRKPSQESDGPAAGPAQGFFSVAGTAFALIFLAEWGDLTQFSTAALAAKYHSPWTIFLAAVTGLWAAIGLAGWLGSKAGLAFTPKVLQRVAAAVFAVVGIWTLLG
ncbi:MAG TPA: TMEM165/GDT1 family protein [bacterium]|jgi:putative Ca2+/H+ antiporter (TMEM165/GDT1 family)|nr:TMEM165/GDT1 family protein [bacterium]